MLNSSTPSECIPVFESDPCKTYDRSSKCRECKDSLRFPVMFKDSSNRFHVKCVPNDLNGRFSDTVQSTGLFGFVDSTTPDQRILSIYEESCANHGEYYLSTNISDIQGLKLINDDGRG